MSTYQYKRDLSQELSRLAKHFPAVVLTGSRQTGKTTLLRSLFPEHTYVSLDLPSDSALAEDDPETFLNRYPPPLLIDEVQYAPKLFRHLKIAIDKQRELNGQYILTGSQKFTLMKEVSESLAGRCGVLELEALSISELGDVFGEVLEKQGLSNILCRGFMPQLWKDLDLEPVDFFRSYVASYIERDVRQILNISSTRDFDRFLRACAIRSGQILNKSELAKDVGVTAKTIHEWMGILEASNQITLLEPYYTNLGKRLVKSPKLFFNDTGLLCFFLGLTPASVTENYLIGAIWESFVFAELRKTRLILAPESSLWFYRDQSREVDFVLEKGLRNLLMDAKWKQYPDKKDFQSLDKTKVLFRNAVEDLLVLCRTPNSYPITTNHLAVSGFKIQEIFARV